MNTQPLGLGKVGGEPGEEATLAIIVLEWRLLAHLEILTSP